MTLRLRIKFWLWKLRQKYPKDNDPRLAIIRRRLREANWRHHNIPELIARDKALERLSRGNKLSSELLKIVLD